MKTLSMVKGRQMIYNIVRRSPAVPWVKHCIPDTLGGRCNLREDSGSGVELGSGPASMADGEKDEGCDGWNDVSAWRWPNRSASLLRARRHALGCPMARLSARSSQQ
jgi:hypothetical protein